MKSLKRRFSAAPEGTTVLFFIQILATLGVLYSTLVLSATLKAVEGAPEVTA